jgi:hypothetical protein
MSATSLVIGYGQQKIPGANNISIGYKAGLALTGNGSFDNVLIGTFAGQRLTTLVRNNVAIGSTALRTATNPQASVFIGTDACSLGDPNDGNVVIGYSAGKYLVDSNNVYVGREAGSDNLGGGYGAGGFNNIGIGYQAGKSITGDYNICFLDGMRNGVAKTGTGNIAMGFRNLDTLTSGSHNLCIGEGAGRFSTTPSFNIALGYHSLYNTSGSTSGSNNISIGHLAMNGNTGITGDDNISIGRSSGHALTSGASSIFIGVNSGATIATGSGNIFIGQDAGNVFGDVSNNLAIASNGTTLVSGDFSTNSITSGGVAHNNGSIQATGYGDLGALGAAPGTPSSGFGRLFALNDGSLQFTNDAGTTTNLTSPSATTTTEVLTADGAVSNSLTYTIFNSATPLQMTLADPTVATQKYLTTINNTESTITLDNGDIVKIGPNQSVTLIYDPSLGYWTTTSGDSNQFLDQDQTGAFNSVNLAASVALSNDGNTMAIGYPASTEVSIYTRSGTTWTFQQTVSDAGSGFGTAVALDTTGTILLVGEPGNTNGFVFIYQYSVGPGWVSQGSFTPNDNTGAAAFGTAIAMNEAGTIAIIGGPTDDTNIGATWFFADSGGWAQVGSKHVGTLSVGAAFQGLRVALSGDGLTGVVGAPNNDTSVGAVWIYTYSGGVWSQFGDPLIIPASTLIGGYPVTSFGSGVAINSDGTRLLITGATQGGSSYSAIFTYYTFTELGYVQSQGFNLNPGFDGSAIQYQISCSYNGNQVIVGIPRDAVSPSVNFAAILSFSGGQYTLVKLTNNATVDQDMGDCVAISGNGSTYAVGGANITGSTGVYVKV